MRLYSAKSHFDESGCSWGLITASRAAADKWAKEQSSDEGSRSIVHKLEIPVSYNARQCAMIAASLHAFGDGVESSDCACETRGVTFVVVSEFENGQRVKKPPSDEGDLIERFADYLANDRHFSPYTIRCCRIDIEGTSRDLDGPLLTATAAELIATFDRTWSKQTKTRKAASLRSFFKWAVLREYVETNPMEGVSIK